MPKYRWATPYEWLLEQDKERPEIWAGIRNILQGTDSDTIQDEFQDLMDQAGYFEYQEPLNRVPADNEEWVTIGDPCGQSGCPHHENGEHYTRCCPCEDCQQERRLILNLEEAGEAKDGALIPPYEVHPKVGVLASEKDEGANHDA